MEYKFETIREDYGIVVLQLIPENFTSIIPKLFNESPKLKIGYMNYTSFPKSGHILVYKSNM